ncbi:MAG: putative DNA binding domain-containing protein [Flavobacteriales bacterium]|nr:putative DNA binding domain-containing protein [Flavobacteriales bacterium]
MAAFHYVVRTKVIKQIKGTGEIDFLEVEKVFENESPIIARNLAFEHYQSYIDVLLKAKGLEYVSDKQTKVDLATFISPNAVSKIQFENSEVEFNSLFGNGIGVFMIIDFPMPDDQFTLKEGDELFVHGIGQVSFLSDDPNRMITELQREFEYYEFFKYPTNHKITNVLFCSQHEWEEGYRDAEPATYQILETPFSWEGLDVPYWWEQPAGLEVKQTQQSGKSLDELIAGGENSQVEFKPALVYNFSTERGGIGIKGIIAKSINAFLNSDGGFLFIGLNDNGNPQGLSHDYSLSEGKNEKDFFLLEFDNMLKHFLGFSIRNSVSGQFYHYIDKEIFVVTVSPSKRRPIFVNGQNGKEFYVRGEASSKQLTDPEELVNYCLDKWGTN